MRIYRGQVWPGQLETCHPTVGWSRDPLARFQLSRQTLVIDYDWLLWWVHESYILGITPPVQPFPFYPPHPPASLQTAFSLSI